MKPLSGKRREPPDDIFVTRLLSNGAETARHGVGSRESRLVGEHHELGSIARGELDNRARLVVALRTGMADVGAAGTAIEVGQLPATDISFLVYPPAVSLTLLAVATVLSVYEPGGRVRRRSQGAHRSAARGAAPDTQRTLSEARPTFVA